MICLFMKLQESRNVRRPFRVDRRGILLGNESDGTVFDGSGGDAVRLRNADDDCLQREVDESVVCAVPVFELAVEREMELFPRAGRGHLAFPLKRLTCRIDDAEGQALFVDGAAHGKAEGGSGFHLHGGGGDHIRG